jgi:FAD:protein FMN transferase
MNVVARQWRVMGSHAEIIVVDGPPGSLAHARHRLGQLERRWSRFVTSSDVSRMNRNAGRPVAVSADTRRLVAIAIDAWRESGGAVNPTVLGAVLRAGYDASFDSLIERAAAPASPLAMIACTDIVIDGETVTLPTGTGFDPGGIGKGLAADVVAVELREAGAEGVCVNVGGDLRVSGLGPTGGGWTIAIDTPLDDRTIVDVGLGDGAVATSTTARRRWRIDGRERHHLIDPETGQPSTSDLVQATALSAECWLAETYAKATLLRGSQRAFDLLPEGVGALALRLDGRVIGTDALRAHLGPAGLPDHIDIALAS